MKNFFNSMLWKLAWRIVLFLLIISAIVCILAVFQDVGLAESDTEDVWVLCTYESFVNIRENPRKSSFAFGGVTCGTRLKTDGEEKGDYLHVVDVPAEESEGWISKQFIVHSEPVRMTQPATVVSNGRLAARKGIGGKVQYWMNPMDTLTIFWWTDEWCLTNKGYVQTEFLELDGEN